MIDKWGNHEMIFFTEKQKRLQEQVRNFAEKKLKENAQEHSKLSYTVPKVLKEISNQGYLGMTTPQKYGGNPIDCVSIGIVFEEICKIDFSAFSFMLSHVLIPLVMDWACVELREEWLPLLCKGEKLACFGNTEPNAGSDASAITSTAMRDGDSYIINGEKTSISGGMQADVIFLTVKTDIDAGVKGITCFLVPLNFSGISRSRFSDMGAHPASRASIFFNNVRVPIHFKIGNEGEGFNKIMVSFDFARVLVVLAAIGMAKASLLEAIGFASKRKKFGKSISRFESVSFKLAENATLIEASRLLCYQALRLKDEGQPHTKECAMAKWYAAECASSAIHDFLVIMGFQGYSEDLPVEQRLRDVIGTKIGDGTAEIMKLIIARHLLGSKLRPII
jgi:cyclohexanecarboxyl-CoA dehydrogenase